VTNPKLTMQQDSPKLQAPGTLTTSTGPALSEGFTKVDGGEKEQTSAEGTLILAYLLIWAIMVFFLSRILRGQAEMQALSQRIADSMKGSSNDRS
jgi:hypothetical protein